MGLNSEKMEALYVEVNKRVEAVTSSYLHPATFHNILILCLWLRIKKKPNQGA